MSVILKALARAQRENAARKNAAKGSAQPAETTGTGNGLLSLSQIPSAKVLLIAAMAILLIVTAGALITIGYAMGRLAGFEAGIQAASARKSQPATGSAIAPGTTQNPAADLPVVAPGVASSASGRAAPRPVTDDLPPPMPMGQSVPSVARTDQTSAGSQTASQAPASPRTFALTSITYSGANKQAVINGAIVHEGETTADFTVLKITASTVTIQRRDDGRILSLSLSRS